MPYLTNQRCSRRPRLAFTIIELLLVIAIIGVLVGLTAGAVIRLMGTAQASSTQAGVKKVQSALVRQWNEIKDKATKDPIPAAYKPTLVALAGGDEKRARVIWVKVKLLRDFPMSFNEALNPITLGAGVTMPSPYKNKLNQLGIVAGNELPPEQQSAVCLHLALLERGGLASEELTKGVTTTLTATNGSRVPAFADAWSSPLLFCRWPTGDPFLNPGSVAQSGFNDPEDPQGLLNDPAWSSSANAATFMSLCHVIPVRATQAAPPSSYKLQPLVVSAGPDRTLGLSPADFSILPVSNTNYYDNVYSK